jgi:SAM-dependent methyltransferase
MRDRVQAFVDSAAEAFGLTGPFYQVGFLPQAGTDTAWWPREGPGPAGPLGRPWHYPAEMDRLPLADAAAETVLCIGTPEYGWRPYQASEEITRVLAPGGALLICASVAGAGPEQTPYWHLTPRSAERLLVGMAATLVGWQGADPFPHTIYGIGFKPPLRGTVPEGTSRFLAGFQARLDASAARAGWHRRLKDFLTAWTQSRSRRRHRRDYNKIQFAVHLSVDPDQKHNVLESCLPDQRTGTRLDLTE